MIISGKIGGILLKKKLATTFENAKKNQERWIIEPCNDCYRLFLEDISFMV